MCSLVKNVQLFVFLGYVFLFLGIFTLDQSTKFHGEKVFLTDSSPTNAMQYRSQNHRMFTLGIDPRLATDLKTEPTANWLSFDLTYVRNQGAIWGAFSDLPDGFRTWFFNILTFIALIVVLNWLRKTRSDQILFRSALTCVLAGALGNFCDRIVMAYVIDWLHFSWRIWGWEYSFPVFNVADISIDTGIGLMILDGIKNGGVNNGC